MRRRFVAAGFAAGIAAAFGAPVGGTLIAFEMSQPNTFWRFEGMWQTFMCAAFAVFTLAFFDDSYTAIGKGHKTDWTMRAALFDMGFNIDSDIFMEHCFMGIVLGVICGPLGALLLTINTYTHMLRTHFLKEKWMKLMDILVLAIVTSTFFFFAPYMINGQCVPDEDLREEVEKFSIRYNCPDGFYSPLATMLLNTQSNTAKSLVYGAYASQDDATTIELTLGHMGAFFGLWYFFAMISNDSFVPSGMIVPGMLCGGALGSIYNEIRIGAFGWTGNKESSAPIFIGAGAMLASYMPTTYSLAVLIMETTNAFNIIIPLMISMQFSRSLSKMIVDYSLYDRGLRLKNIPLLREFPPNVSKKLAAW